MFFDFIKNKMALSNFLFNKRYDKFIYNEEYQKLEDVYYDEMNEIEGCWSLLSKSKDYDGEDAEYLESLCYKNIDSYKNILKYCDKYKVPYWECVPVFKRLSMLYEKREDYNNALAICFEAIVLKAVSEYGDGNKKKMYKRLKRLIKKNGFSDYNSTIDILNEKNFYRNGKRLSAEEKNELIKILLKDD